MAAMINSSGGRLGAADEFTTFRGGTRVLAGGWAETAPSPKPNRTRHLVLDFVTQPNLDKPYPLPNTSGLASPVGSPLKKPTRLAKASPK